jgi:hypothetical protein
MLEKRENSLANSGKTRFVAFNLDLVRHDYTQLPFGPSFV